MTDPDLRRAVRALALAARKLERATGDLTLAQYRVLALVAAGDERSSLVAERLAVAKPTITAVVGKMETLGLVTRETDSNDRRVTRIRITPAGVDKLDEVRNRRTSRREIDPRLRRKSATTSRLRHSLPDRTGCT